jgi:hypothetical protein
VLTKPVNLWPASRLDEFMPWTWASSNQIVAPQQVAPCIADPMVAWSSFPASPEAPKTAMSPLELDGYLAGIIETRQASPILPSK